VNRRLIAPLGVAVIAAASFALSCTEISTNPTTVTAIEFDSLPYPAVVTGDTLRDSLGQVAPLHAIAFNSSGGVIPNAGIRYYALDSGLTIDPTGVVTAQARNGSVRIIASAPNLQSNAETLIVARRPDSVVATSPVVDTLFYALPDNASNVSPPLVLQVATRDSSGGIPGTQGWLVSYQVLFHGRALAVADTSVASIWVIPSVASLVAVTGPTGVSSVVLRVRPAGLPTAAESLLVLATVKYHGVQIQGSPVSYLIQARPQTTPSR
jgi:hypothetical protein